VLGLPSPDQLGSAAANLFDATLRGGVADLQPMPSTVIDRGPQRCVARYLPVESAPRRRRPAAPVLLVPPLAAPAVCFDLRRGCSLAEYLVRSGRRTYLVDYGAIQFADRDLGIEHWVHEVIPAAVRAVAHDAGDRPVRIVGWCLGGIMALLAHAADAGLPIQSLALVASPWDVSKVPLVAPLRPIDAMTRGWVITQLYRALGGAPAPLVKRGYQLAGFDKYVMKPWTLASNLHDRDLLAQIEAVDAFMDRMHAYPGRTFGQLYHRFLRTNDLARGRLELGGQVIDLQTATAPLLAVAGRGDGIAPVKACHHLADLVPNAPAVRLETAPGGHLGVLTGRAARASTWAMLDEWLDAPTPRRRARRVAPARAA
jgi:polyhydroxyalkanoate synthase